MQAVIMAGGKGKRLRPLTSTVPKPLVKILGKPVISYILELLVKNGVEDVRVTLGYMPETIESFLAENEFSSLKLSCVTEFTPLGTAGSVKNAAKDFSGDFIVISGDCMCDYDIAAAVDFHRASGAALTVVTAQVDDPREYGLVKTQADGKITGFCEKPDWANITSNQANTGIYIVSPHVLNLIPEEKAFDFSKDLFPLMLARDIPLYAYPAKGYWCDIGDLTAYRMCQQDLLSGKADISLSGVCEGVYLKADMPDGDFNIIPPVYIGENTEIAAGALIGPFTVLGDGCFVGENARIANSVMADCSAAFAGTSMKEAILCENAVLEENGKMFENSVLGAQASAGRNTRICKNVSVWPQITVENGVTVRENLRSVQERNPLFTDNGLEGTLAGSLSPEKCCRIGQALASSMVGGRTGIATDGKTASKAAANALIGGLMASGAHVFNFGECFLAELSFFTAFCSLNAGIYISARQGKLQIRICGEGGLSLSRAAERDIEKRMESCEFDRCDSGKLRDVSDMSGVNAMYRRELLRQSGMMLPSLNANVVCANPKISMLMEDCLYTLGCRCGDEITFKINGDGTSLSAFHRACGWIPKDKLLAVCCLDELRNGHDVAVPYDAPHSINTLAAEYERRVMRYMRTPPDNSDCEARALAVKQTYARDGLFMAVKLLGIMEERKRSLPQLLAELPAFFIRRRNVEIAFTPSRLYEAVGADAADKAVQGILLKEPRGRVLLTPSKTGKRIQIAAEAVSFETSCELCAEVEEKIKAFGMQQK